jgi:hypothetical protein
MSDPLIAVVDRAMPVGPWLLVIGMHRSGTSAVTGALGHLGFAIPATADRWEPSEDNPDHWESRALGDHDDLLLERLGGIWDRPPNTDPGWECDPGLGIDDLGDPGAAASKAFPNPGPIVWKDPRTSLLLPYWLARLPKPIAAVFIWRSPMSVARSLQARDGIHLADGIALWERYNRSGLAGLVGIDTFVTRYESIVENPLDRLGALADWLGKLPQFTDHAPDWDLTRAVTSIAPQFARQQASDDAGLLLDEQRRLTAHLKALEGPHQPLSPALPGTESAWTTALLADRHELAALSRQRDTLRERARLQSYKESALKAKVAALISDLERARSELDGMYDLYERMRASTSWRITRPLREIPIFGRRTASDNVGTSGISVSSAIESSANETTQSDTP